MNSLSLNDTLYRVAANTIEELALMFLMPQEEAMWSPTDSRKTVHVGFTGPLNGDLILVAPELLLSQLAANMLGLDDSDKIRPEDGEDALKELGNVICGNLLPAVAGPDPIFCVATPSILEDDASFDTTNAAARVQLYVECGAIELALLSEDIHSSTTETAAESLS